ncbi:hypothetical protein [Companilactobacillus sp.]|uniref:hypothetical protein n=1 Tax=Companilactobacillus sp. TaxID=2767905 RepID=UPI0025C57613|nr:hypothetical protein [Companilactobacillus sp.]MCH4008568.1 hypothetical protein [Companilactobacillus sp.]MCH4051253.1 hypothetical protein [Companilactobacillus sp.]MCH4076511.1 hypothetical protein [Companilactobacillus sp.]MCH4125086.1 hypothetical protein [Companilactobacillus sp.]MCH4131627.1 hypothetical protein [Companilactobacillus sp.]
MRKKNRLELVNLIDDVISDTEGTSLVPVLESFRSNLLDGHDNGSLLDKMYYNIRHISLSDRNVNSDRIYDLLQFIDKSNVWHDLGKHLVKSR